MSNRQQESRIYYHVGLERTGTTFLQKSVFPHFSGIGYISKKHFAESPDIVGQGKYKTYLVSKEPEMGDTFEREIAWFASHFPDARPIIVLRPHVQWVRSQLKRYIKNGHRISGKQLVDPDSDKGVFKMNDLKYMRKVDQLKETFTKPPTVLSYLDLRENPEAFVQTIADLTGASVDLDRISFKPRHTSYSNKQLRALLSVMRFVDIERVGGGENISRYAGVNALVSIMKDVVRYVVLYGALLVPDAILAEKPLISDRMQRRIEEIYAEDWQQAMGITTSVTHSYSRNS